MDTASTTTDFEPWEAFVLDADGFVMPEEDIRGWVETKSADIDATYFATDSEPEEIVIARGSARPVPQSTGSDILRAPGSRMWSDYLVPAIDASSLDPQDIAEQWERAKLIASAANTAAIR